MDCRKSISVPLVKSTRPCLIFGKVVENLWNWCHGKYTLCRLLDSKNQPPPSSSRLASIPRKPRCWHHPQSVTMDNWAEHQPYKLPQCNIGIVVEIFEKCTISKIRIVRPTISILLSLPQEFPQLSKWYYNDSNYLFDSNKSYFAIFCLRAASHELVFY